MEEEKKSYRRFAFNWGSIIGFVTLVYFLIGYYTRFERYIYFGDIYLFLDIALIGGMFSSFRREYPEEPLKFSKMMMIGFRSALVAAGFYALYYLLRIIKLDPFFFSNYMNEVIKFMNESMQTDYSQMINNNTANVLKGAFVFAMYISSLITSMIYTLFLAAFLSLNQKMFTKR